MAFARRLEDACIAYRFRGFWNILASVIEGVHEGEAKVSSTGEVVPSDGRIAYRFEAKSNTYVPDVTKEFVFKSLGDGDCTGATGTSGPT